MLYALSWFLVLMLLAIWSLTAWALHSLAVWTVTNAGALSGAAANGGAVGMPEVLAPWVPPEIAQWVGALAASLGPAVDSLLQAAPMLAAGLTVVTWVVWGIGTVLLVLLGVGLHVLIALWRGRSGGGSGPEAGRSLATS